MKKNTPNIHLQNKAQYVNDDYVLSILPKLYVEMGELLINACVVAGFRDNVGPRVNDNVGAGVVETVGITNNVGARITFTGKKALTDHSKTVHLNIYD